MGRKISRVAQGSDRRTFLKATAAAGVAFAGWSGFPFVTKTSAAAARGPAVDNKTLVVADSTTPQSLDYDQSEELQAQEANANLYANWIEYDKVKDPAGFMRPDVKKLRGVLAESWESSSDGKMHTVKLHEGVKSNYGNELTTDDILYMFQRHFATKTTGEFQSRVASINSADQIKPVDRYTFEIRLDAPNQIFWDALVPSLTTNVWDSVEVKKHATADDPWALKWLGINSAGYGAYFLENLQAGREMTYRSNPGYINGAPKIQKVIYKAVPESSNRLALLQSGDIDVAKDLTPREIEVARKAPGLKVVDVNPSNLWIVCFWNNGMEPFSGNAKLRQALSHAIPYQDIFKTVYFGNARFLKGPMSEVGADFDGSAWNYDLNLDKAKSLLAEAGHANGFKSVLAYNADVFDTEQIAVLMRDSWAKIGVQVDLQKVPSAAFGEGKMTHSYPMFLERNYLIVNRGAYEVPLMFTPGSPINWGNFEADDYGDYPFWNRVQGALSKTGEEARPIWREIQKYLIETAAWGYVANPAFQIAMKEGLSNYTWDTDDQNRWWFLSWT